MIQGELDEIQKSRTNYQMNPIFFIFLLIVSASQNEWTNTSSFYEIHEKTEITI